MKARKLRELTKEEMGQQLSDAEQELFNLRIRRATGRLERPLRLRTLRRDVARMKTVLREKAGA